MKPLVAVPLLLAFVFTPYATGSEPVPADPLPAAGTAPGAPASGIRPGKAKGAWQGEYPVPKPALPEGPAAPVVPDDDAAPAPAGTDRSGEPEPQAPAPH